jgi:type II secretory pathway component GspD/PulD (secretin)
MITLRAFAASSLIVFGAAFVRGEEADQNVAPPHPLVIQPQGEIAHDLKSAAPESSAKPLNAADISQELTNIAKTEAPVDLNRPLTLQEELARLKALPLVSVPLKQAKLYTAIVALAEAANMRYIAPDEGDFSDRIALNIPSMNPKSMLDVLGETYGFTMEYDENSIWHFYRVDLNEMISKTYSLRYNNLSKVVINAPDVNSQLGASSSTFGSGTSSSQNSGGANSNASPFKVDPDRVVTDIKQILGINGEQNIGDDNSRNARTPGHRSGVVPTPQVIWDADNNEILVVATRQQHKLVADYLKMVDQPMKLVRLAVKFIETSRNPQNSFGIDWSGTPIGPNGGPISLAGPGSSGTTLNPLQSNTFSLSHFSSVQLPQAILTSQAFGLTLHAFATDAYSSLVQDPVLVTNNNREVEFKDTTQQPVQNSTTSNLSSTSPTSTSSVTYLEVGPIVSILPVILPGSRPGHELVQLNISIVTSQITGQPVIIAGNPYPVLSSKTYQYTVTLEAGNTLAIAGLDSRTRSTSDNKVPIFGSIPIIGHAFDSKNDQTLTTTLIAFITPTIEDPVSGDKIAVDSSVVVSSRRVFEGSPHETINELRKSLTGLDTDIRTLQSAANPANRETVINRLSRIDVELSLMEVRIDEWRSTKPNEFASELNTIAEDRKLLEAAKSSVNKPAPTNS